MVLRFILRFTVIYDYLQCCCWWCFTMSVWWCLFYGIMMVVIFWSLREDNRPHRSISSNKTMLGLCRAHVGSMLGPCWLCVAPCWAHVQPWWAAVGPMWRHVGQLLTDQACLEKTPRHLRCGRIYGVVAGVNNEVVDGVYNECLMVLWWRCWWCL